MVGNTFQGHVTEHQDDVEGVTLVMDEEAELRETQPKHPGDASAVHVGTYVGTCARLEEVIRDDDLVWSWNGTR